MGQLDITWMIGGAQGSGINASAETFAKACTRAGYQVIADIEYHSNIMGEHSFYRVRVSDSPRRVLSERVHVLVALDLETLLGDRHSEVPNHEGHLHEVVPGGAVVYDAALKLTGERLRDDVLLMPVPFTDLLRQTLAEFGREGEAGSLRVVANSVAVGASLALAGPGLESFQQLFRESFTGRRAALAEINVRAAARGYDYVRQRLDSEFPFRLSPVAAPARRPLLIRGVQAAAIAKLRAGLAFQTYYPISPATDENVYLETHARKYGLVVVQTEDEVSAINMAVGAAHAGARASTSTSGPGFALMVEGLGFAAITEAPGPVVFFWQRGGPSTGLPTRHEQGDLRFALQPAHGDFPLMVVAPGDVADIVEDSYEAFNWADRYQLPVIVLLDKALASTYVTIDDLKLEALPPIDRGPLFTGGNGSYLRYAPTDSGVSPRAIPGQEGGVFWTTSDEHDPRGHVSESAANRVRMMDKRMGKLELAGREIPARRKLALHGPAQADVTVVGWGSTKGAILGSLASLEAEEGLRANFLQVRLLRPFPAEEAVEALGRARKIILVENNYSGQLGGLVRQETGIDIPHRVLKYDGRPFSEEELRRGLLAALRQGRRRVAVSSHSA